MSERFNQLTNMAWIRKALGLCLATLPILAIGAPISPERAMERLSIDQMPEGMMRVSGGMRLAASAKMPGSEAGAYYVFE